MDIKSTVALTRKEAEVILVNLLMRGQKSQVEQLVKTYSNATIEELLEFHNDQAHIANGYQSGLENYLIEE